MRIVILSALLFVASSCASSTPVSDAPLPEAEQQALECTLLGTWTLQSIDNEPTTMTNLSWEFRNDGSGVYKQRQGTGLGAAAVVEGDNNYNWRLEGRNIFLELEQGGKTTVYRADAFDQTSMRWFNYTLSDNYALIRTASAEDGCSQPE